MLPFGSFRIGRILNIPIEVNYTWFIIFVLVVTNLTVVFRAEYDFPLALSFIEGTITAGLFFSSLLLHELSHSLVARRNKIPIQKITLFVFGGVAQMTEEPKNAATEFKMAVAGPLMSLLLGLIFAAALLLTQTFGLGPFISVPFFWLFQINVALAVFNSAPGFPLDGGRVFRAALWYFTGDFTKATRAAAYTGQALAYMIIIAGFYLIISQSNIGGFWLVLIGLFLNQTAQASYRQVLFEKSLSGVTVSDLMSAEVVTVGPELSLSTLVDDFFLKYKFGRFPVTKGDSFLGVITLHDIKEVPRERWDAVTTGQTVHPLDDEHVVRPGDEAVTALMRMAKEDAGHLLVVEAQRLVGIVTRSDIIRLIKVKAAVKV